MSLHAGKYIAKVVGVALEAVGEKNWPAIVVNFKPQTFNNGFQSVEGDFAEVRKVWFLSEELVASGPMAGRSRIELVRENLKETFDYNGGLSTEELNTLIDKVVEIVVEINGAGFASVKWVNKPNHRRGREGKQISPDVLAKLSSAFSGKPKADSVPDPEAFFLKLRQG